MKRCPACSGIVADDASICWHCGAELTPEPGASGGGGVNTGTIVGGRHMMDDTEYGAGPVPSVQGDTLYGRAGIADALGEEAVDALPGAAALDVAAPDSTDIGIRAQQPVQSPDGTPLGAPSGSQRAVASASDTGSGPGTAAAGLGTMFGMHVLDEDSAIAVDESVDERTIFGVRGAMDEANVPGESDLDLQRWTDDTEPGQDPLAPGRPVDVPAPVGDVPVSTGTAPDARPGGGAGDWLDDISAWLKGDPEDPAELGGSARAPQSESAEPQVAGGPAVEPTTEKPTVGHADPTMKTGALTDDEVQAFTGPKSAKTQPVEGAAMIMRRPRAGRKRTPSATNLALAGYGAHAEKSTRQDEVPSHATPSPRKRRPSDDVRVPETVSLDARYRSGSSDALDPSKLPPGVRRPGDSLAYADTGAMPALGSPRDVAPSGTVPDAAFSVIEDAGPPPDSAPRAMPPPRGPSTAPIEAAAVDEPEVHAPAVAETQPVAAVAAPPRVGGTGLTQQLQGLLGDRDPRGPDGAPGAEAAGSETPGPAGATPVEAKAERSGLAWGPIIAVAVVVLGALVGAALALGLLIDG